MVARIETREQLILDIRQSLGEPIIKVNLLDDHISRCIDYALKEFWKHHRDGSVEKFLVYTLTDTDITNKFIKTPETVDAVSEVLPLGYSTSMNNFATVEWQIAAGAMNTANGIGYGAANGNPGGTVNGNETLPSGGFRGISMADWAIARQAIQDIRMMTGADNKNFRFGRYERKLYPIFPTKAGDTICLRAFVNADPELDPDSAHVFDDEWLKALATAQTKIAWGNVLRKYGQITLPGGVVLDGKEIMDEGTASSDQLIDEIKNEQPIDFLVG